MAKPFLAARWENLVLANFAAPKPLLAPLVPKGTELDEWQDETLVSLVGLYFKDTRVLGVSIPGHRHFAEVNLRFYVRRACRQGGHRRAVVFIRELVPRSAIAAVARWVYNEPYLAVSMHHHAVLDGDEGGQIRYSWRYGGAWHDLAATVSGPLLRPPEGSEAEFITEHHWGYTLQRDGSTLEYHVEHPQWRVWASPEVTFQGSATRLYGEAFGRILSGPMRSAFVAEGSRVVVRAGRRIV